MSSAYDEEILEHTAPSLKQTYTSPDLAFNDFHDGDTFAHIETYSGNESLMIDNLEIDADYYDEPINEPLHPQHQTKKTKPALILIACIVSLGGLLFGLDLGGIGASFLMEGFRYHFGWDCPDQAGAECVTVEDSTIDRDKGFISLFFGIGAVVGSLSSPHFAEQHGRRRCLALSSLVYIFGAILQTSAPTMYVLWIGRLFTGVGIGMLSMVAPVYTAEISPKHVRGSLGIFWDLAATFGLVMASAANIGLKEWEAGWKFAYGCGIIFSSILLLSLMFMPESPRWLAAKGREADLDKALRLVRYEDDIENEKAELRSEIQDEEELGDATWSEVFSSDNMMRRRVLLGTMFFAVQQLGGITAVMFYAPDILNTFFTEDEAILGTLALTLIALLTTTVTVSVVDRFGRTKLLVYGGSVMTICLFILAYFSAMEENIYLGWSILLFSALFNVANALSWGPALWVLCTEIYPYRFRGKATGLTTMSHWLFATIVGAVFPVASSASLSACFICFAAFIMLGTFAVYFLQVETSGLTSAQIDEAFLNHKPTLKRKDW